MSRHGPARPDGVEMPLRPALVKQDDDDHGSSRAGPAKVVSIANPEVSPTITSLEHQTPKQFSAGLSKRLSGRPSASSSRTSLASLEELPGAALKDSPGLKESHHFHLHGRHSHDKLLSQVSEWLHAEKAKRAAKKSGKAQSNSGALDRAQDGPTSRPRSGSESSNGSTISLEKLQRILEGSVPPPYGADGLGATSVPRAGSRPVSSTYSPRRRSSLLVRHNSSDTEYQDGDIIVPSCDVLLDNSKTLSYPGGGTTSTADLSATSAKAEKDRNSWSEFRSEILKLAHTLRLKGWRRVPLDRGDDIEVKRLSGALTNAVYVVSPPSSLPSTSTSTTTSVTSNGVNTGPTAQPRNPPPKLLLRIYGPQVEHLIDRENELGILRRLARKKIGPRLLGTFTNGRFEEYFDSTTLTSEDLRIPETSKQIAKRMRELHDGIDLLERERDEGPFVWRNWDKWVVRCEKIVNFLDEQANKAGATGYVCGVEWKQFRGMVDTYRKWLADYYGGEDHVREKLVFAHNDTQYGNLLRLQPLNSESPLLLPANTHKQLIVIDFEYASANTPGLEFANHFTEWCYNYHDFKAPHRCNTDRYPTREEQRRFIRSYVSHRPQFNARASQERTPMLGPRNDSGVGSIKEFMLDSRTPGGSGVSGYDVEEERRIAASEKQIDMLVKEAQIWRIANSAQWVAWGIVQAKVPGLEDDESSGATAGTQREEDIAETETHEHPDKRPEGLTAEVLLKDNPSTEELKEAREEEAEDGEDEFDYLGYARDRAMFFWGDCVELGLIKVEQLPADVQDALKIVRH